VLQDDNGAWHEHNTRLRFDKTALPRRNGVL
jgi:hypothetical protein